MKSELGHLDSNNKLNMESRRLVFFERPDCTDSGVCLLETAL